LVNERRILSTIQDGKMLMLKQGHSTMPHLGFKAIPREWINNKEAVEKRSTNPLLSTCSSSLRLVFAKLL
jgi:hypothetical protein